jgi:hypothetical protein
MERTAALRNRARQTPTSRLSWRSDKGDVARDLVARNLHATGAEKRDADPREIYPELCGSTRARVVLDRVAFHLEVIYGLRRKSFEEHARAVVVDRVSGE